MMSEIVCEVELFGVGAADDHRECVFESQGLGDFEIETLGVALFTRS